jgi:hypothetical protein
MGELRPGGMLIVKDGFGGRKQPVAVHEQQG